MPGMTGFATPGKKPVQATTRVPSWVQIGVQVPTVIPSPRAQGQAQPAPTAQGARVDPGNAQSAILVHRLLDPLRKQAGRRQGPSLLQWGGLLEGKRVDGIAKQTDPCLPGIPVVLDESRSNGAKGPQGGPGSRQVRGGQPWHLVGQWRSKILHGEDERVALALSY